MTLTYEEQVKEEGAFWDAEVEKLFKEGYAADLDVKFRAQNPISMWEDSDIEKIMRGGYKDYIIKEAAQARGQVLELGCGSGWLSLAIARLGAHVTGVDITEKSIKRNQERAQEFGLPNLQYLYQDVNKLELVPDSLDAVVVWDALHHFAYLENVLVSIRHGLKSGGSFLVWDHIGRQGWRGGLAKLLAYLGFLILPTDLSYKDKLLYPWRRLRGQAALPHSPFEDVVGPEMQPLIEQYFTIVKRKTALAFTPFFVARIRLKNKKWRLRLVRWCRNLDRALVKIRLLQGEYIFIHAIKPLTYENISSSDPR